VLKSDNPHENAEFIGISLIKFDIELSNLKWILFESQLTYLRHIVLFRLIWGAVQGAKLT